MVLEKWIVSPLFKDRPDVNCWIEDYDMNSWQPFSGIGTINLKNARYVLLRTTFEPNQSQQEKGGIILLPQVRGKVEVWLNGRKIGTKTTKGENDFQVGFPAIKDKCDLRILLIGESGSSVELKGNIRIKDK